MYKLLLFVLSIANDNRRVYSDISKTLTNDYIMAQYNYPRDISPAQKLLVNYNPIAISSSGTSDRILFAANGIPRVQKDKSKITCF